MADDACSAFRLFFESFFDTDFTLGRSLIAVVGDTSDGAIGDDVTVVMVAFGNKLLIFVELVMLAVVDVTKKFFLVKTHKEINSIQIHRQFHSER